ncbi:MAG: hypothetical protein KF756_14315 [Acidobacteria bacterium]|nr:hypothetical protein [Acidobacteriota bacterium]
MEIKFTSQVVVSPEETNGRLPRRSLDLLNINTPELMQLAPLRSEIAPKGLARARALVAYSERLRNTYRANESGLREGMKLLAETVNNGQPIVVSCFCRAGEMCHADVVKLAIEKVQQRVLLHDRAKRKAEHSPSITRSVDIPNPRTQRAINEILSVSKSDLLLARIDQTDGRSRYEHASYLNQHSQFARDLYERGATVSGNAVIVPKEKLSIAAGLDIPTNQYAVKKLEHITGDRSKVAELAPQIVEYGQKIAGSDADRETQLRVFNWIYQSLEGKTEFLDSGDRTFSEESKEERFERTMTDIANLAHELSQLEPSDHFVPLDTVFERDHDHAKDENHELLRDEDGSLARGPSEATNASHVEFERFEIGNLELAQMASEMSHNEREHWFNVKLPAIDKELEDGKPVDEILEAYRDTIYTTAIHEPSRKHEAVDDLRFAAAYIEKQLEHPDSRLRHFNARYRKYAAMLDRATTRQEVIEAGSFIRKDNSQIGFRWKELSDQERSETAIAVSVKELQFLFTESSPPHYSSEMTAAKMSYSHFGKSREEKTQALFDGKIRLSTEGQQLLHSLEARLERSDLRHSFAATKHFLSSLSTPSNDLRNPNEFDHAKTYQDLPPYEKDFIFGKAMHQRDLLETRVQERYGEKRAPDKTFSELTKLRVDIVNDLVKDLSMDMTISQSRSREIVVSHMSKYRLTDSVEPSSIDALSHQVEECLRTRMSQPKQINYDTPQLNAHNTKSESFIERNNTLNH